MSKIIFSLTSGLPNSSKIPCFYEGFVNALVREGNEVLVIVNNKIVENCWKNNIPASNLNTEKFKKKILDFNPDLIFAWNNSLCEGISELVTCPIIVYGVDSPAVFVDVENFKKNLQRYHIIIVAEQFVEMINQNFGKNYQSLNIVGFATEIRAQKLVQDKNISFIGTNFNFAADKFKKMFFGNFSEEQKRQFNIFYKSFLSDVLTDPKEHIAKNNLDANLLKNISHIDLLNLISSNNRIQILASISDLGLSLYGGKSWHEVVDYSLSLALSFIDQEVSSLQENQDIYNSSKISINISHAQAGNAFSWRVRDAMASNSVVISDPRKDLETEFGKYVKIPTYENPFEARKLCEKLLKDEIWRKELVMNSQIAIEENHRFNHRMRDIEQIVGISLFSKGKGCVEFLNVDEYLSNFFFINEFKACNKIVISKKSLHFLRSGIFCITLFLKDCFCKRHFFSKFLRKMNRERIRICRRIKGKIRCKNCGHIK
jgi:hypothetical protein